MRGELLDQESVTHADGFLIVLLEFKVAGEEH